jgi:multidrug resistance protein, MATE family
MEPAAPTKDLRLATTYRQIIHMAVPISLAIFIPQFNFITNNYFLGQYDASGDTLAVGGIVGVYYLIFAVIGYGLNNGLQALISRRAGEGRIEEISKLFWNGIRISLVFAAVAIAISYTVGPWVLRRTMVNQTEVERAISFIKIRVWGLPFLYIYQMRNALLVATNNSRYLVLGTLAETVSNILLDYGLILGHFGMPALGLNGAAHASIAAEFIGMAVVYIVVYAKGIGRSLQLGNHLAFNKDVAWLIFVKSLPLVFQMGISIVTWEYFYITVERHGQTLFNSSQESAISNVMRNVFGFFGCTSWAFASTCSTLVSNVIGQGRENEVLTVINRVARISFLVALVPVLCICIFPEPFLRIFNSNPSFVANGIPVLRVVALALLLLSFSNITLNGVTGTGNTRVNLYIEFFAVFVYVAYVYLTLEHFKLSLTIGWMCEWLYWICLFVPAFFYLRSGRWKGKVF